MNERPPDAAPLRRLRALAYALGALAACALIALFVAMGNVGATQTELASARDELAQAQQQIAQAQQQVTAVVAEHDQLAQALAGTTTHSALTGKGGHATLLQSSGGELVLAAQLPPLGPAQVYQLWLSVGTGAAPVSVGVLSVNHVGYGLLAIGTGTAIAGATLSITAEPAPGSPTPTTPTLIAGQIS